MCLVKQTAMMVNDCYRTVNFKNVPFIRTRFNYPWLDSAPYTTDGLGQISSQLSYRRMKQWLILSDFK